MAYIGTSELKLLGPITNHVSFWAELADWRRRRALRIINFTNPYSFSQLDLHPRHDNCTTLHQPQTFLCFINNPLLPRLSSTSINPPATHGSLYITIPTTHSLSEHFSPVPQKHERPFKNRPRCGSRCFHERYVVARKDCYLLHTDIQQLERFHERVHRPPTQLSCVAMHATFHHTFQQSPFWCRDEDCKPTHTLHQESR